MVAAADGHRPDRQLQVDPAGGVHLQVDPVRGQLAEALAERRVAVVERRAGAVPGLTATVSTSTSTSVGPIARTGSSPTRISSGGASWVT